MARKRTKKPSCKKVMKQAQRAFARGDNARGRKLYHKASKGGCSTALTLDGFKRAVKGKKRCSKGRVKKGPRKGRCRK